MIALGSHQGVTWAGTASNTYILTYYRFRTRKPLIAMGSHQGMEGGGGGALISAFAVPQM